MKRRLRRIGWSGSQLGAGACIVVSMVCIAIALMQNGSQAKPGWTVMNAQVGRALAPLEQREADMQKQAGVKKAQQAANKQERTEVKEAEEKQADEKQADEAKVAADAKNGNGAVPASGEPSKAADDAAAVPGSGSATAAGQGASASNEGKIDINHASAAELDALPGIGASKADAIVADRGRNGLFRHVDDLLRVKGIGPKLLDKLKSYIVLHP